MDGAAFLDVAYSLLDGESEAYWRSAVSRAYYGAFHVGRRLLEECGFKIVDANSRAFVMLRLGNCRFPEVEFAGKILGDLRAFRNHADYDLLRPFAIDVAVKLIHSAANVVETFQFAANEPTVRAKLTDAIKLYERDVLRQVTWKA